MKKKITSIALMTISLLVILHHYIISQRIADQKDVLHHEFLAGTSLTAGIILFISNYNKKGRD